jgi:hypothetical protein
LLLGIAAAAPAVRAETGGAVQAIIESEPDPGHPAVVGFVWRDQGALFCTGTLVAPRVVLTTAHCVYDLRIDTYAIFFGPFLGEGRLVKAVEAVIHPRYGATGVLDDSDIALVILAQAAPEAPHPMWTRSVDVLLGRAVRLVGYGVLERLDEESFEKRAGRAVVQDVDQRFLVLEPGPSLPCFGDSGGPAFYEEAGVEYVVGLNVRGDCVQRNTETRVDRYVESFVRPVLEAAAPGGAGLGDRCHEPGQCAAGLACEATGDEPALSFCTAPCAATADCRLGMICGANLRCAWPTPSPGALGSTCSFPAQCIRGACVAPRGPPGVCREWTPPGCSSLGDQVPSGLFLALLTAALALRVRRGRR